MFFLPKTCPEAASDFVGFRRKTKNFVEKPKISSEFVGCFFLNFRCRMSIFCLDPDTFEPKQLFAHCSPMPGNQNVEKVNYLMTLGDGMREAGATAFPLQHKHQNLIGQFLL